MNEFHQNWQTLCERGVSSVAAISGDTLHLEIPAKKLALTIGYAFLQKLDMLGDYPMYGSYVLERVLEESEQRLQDGQTVIFGEMRPADRNCALSISQEYDNTYVLRADVRNDFEDRPELDGGKKLQEKFIEAIESLEL